MRLYSFFLLLFFALGLTGCARYVQLADYKPAAALPYDAAPAPVLFRDIELLLPLGAEIGFVTSGTPYCRWPRRPVSRAALKDAVDKKYLKQAFHDALEAQGYDVVGGFDIAYDLEDELDRAEYSVKAKVRHAELDLCNKEPDENSYVASEGILGEFYMEVDWTVYDPLRRAVIYKTRTAGYNRLKTPNLEGLALLFTGAFEMAAHNLGADKGFSDLLVQGVAPQNQRKRKNSSSNNTRPRMYDAQEKVVIPRQAISQTAFTENANDIKRAVVMVQKFGHGSGFFISKAGHILTNAHLVGDGLRTRIVTADGTHKLTAEILRVDKVRDVALLRLESIPAGLEIVTPPVRHAWPGIGEAVYAIGAPKDYRTMQDTVTKGIISAHRKNMRFDGIRQNFLQADVATQTGSDGGPLLDKNGNIVGLAVDGRTGPEGIDIGLNFFIPIGEALKALDIHTQN